ncbi:hypothetical protein BH09ACT12_BH09ACT12_22370 [soil metagenome]
MNRSLMRLLVATLVAIALVAGGSPGPAGAVSAQRDAATSPSEACQADYDTFLSTAVAYNATSKQAKKDAKRVKAKQAKLDKAKKAKQKKRAKRQLRKATRAQKGHARRQSRLKSQAIARYTTWQDCETAAAEAPEEPTTPGPLQELCDAGLPQEVCDAFDSLPVPTPGTGGDSPLQPLCDTGLPQELCDAATLPGTGGDSPLQPLCDLGLPQELCDASLPTLPTDPTVPTDPTDPTLPPDPTDPVLCTLLPILCP